jgi:hypothetical protein
MSWINFLTVIFIVYLIYYALNLFFDLFLSPRVRDVSLEDEQEHFFAQSHPPELIIPSAIEDGEEISGDKTPASAPPFFSSGPLNASGGVGLKQLFSLAKDNLIEHTRAIPY